MTVASATARSGPYTGNGSTTVFAYTFRILDQAHLRVVLTNAAGVESVLELTTHYSVSGVGSSGGGNVTIVTAPTVGETLTIVRAAPYTQGTDFQNQGAYYAETVEDALDLLTMQTQQLDERIDRSVTLPVASTITDLIFPKPTAGTLLGWSSGADALINYVPNSGDYVVADLAAVTAAEARQLQNIGATTISPAQWGYLGAMSVQPAASGGNSDIASLLNLDYALLAEQGSPPATPANSLARYSRRVSGRLEAFIRDESSGAEIQETIAGRPAGLGVRSTSVSLVGVGSATITGIPAGTNFIIASGLDMASQGGALLLRLGHTGGVVDSGYIATTSRHTNGSAANVAPIGVGFALSPADPFVNATATFVLFRTTSNVWCVSAGASDTRDAGYVFSLQGRISLPGELDRLQLRLSSGAFTSGVFNLEAWR